MKRGLLGLLSLVLVFVMLVGCEGEQEELIGSDADDTKTTKLVKLINVDLTREDYGIGVYKKNKKLLKQTNEYLSKIKDDGTMDEILSHYFGDGEPVQIESAKQDSSKDQLIVASTLDFEPFEYGEIDHYYGIDMELAAGLADYLDKELVIVNSNFETMLMSVRQGKCDMCIGGITITPERKKFMNFSQPYYSVAQNIMVRSDNKEFDSADDPEEIENILHARGKEATVGVENLTTAQLYCEGDEESGYKGLGVEVKPYKNNYDACNAMINKEIDYVVLDSVNGQFMVDQFNGDK